MEEEEEEEYDMCQAIKEWIEDERKAGYEEGIKEGIKEGTEEVFKIIIRMNQKGYEIRQIAELVDCTEEKIAEVIAENRKIKK